MRQSERVTFPPDQLNWVLVRDMLSELQQRLFSQTINAQDAALHIQVIYDASQATHQLDEHWVHSRHEVRGQGLAGSRFKLDQSYLWFGVLKYLKKAEKEEWERFMFVILPNIIELALRVEDHLLSACLHYSKQQMGGVTVLSRQFIASILACSFLCLFPERARDRASKLNVVNFTNFFKHLPQSSQIAKLRCILHYFERVIDAGLEMAGSIEFHRQVVDSRVLPTLDGLLRSNIALCPLTCLTSGVIEDVGSSAIQVDFANRSIGGGVLGRGRVQEEIRFSTCPELIAAMVFMENMEDNEAIVISGFEQFSQCTGYASSLQYAGPFHDHARRDCHGNLLNTLCAIDATSFRLGSQNRQYLDGFVMREVNKAYIGFCQAEPDRLRSTWDGAQETSFLGHGEFVATESVAEEGARAVLPEVAEMAEVMSLGLLSHGLVEAARKIPSLQTALDTGIVSEDNLHLADISLCSASDDNVLSGHAASTPRDDTSHSAQDAREDSNSHIHGGNGERLSLPMIIPRPQNGSCDLLEVDYSEWLANFRRRSSQLSDLTSRRSSSSTKHSSEFSSDLEEIYETLVQAEKAQHGIIEEETYGAALSDYAATFVSSLMREGTSVAAQLMPDVKDFEQGQLPVGVHRPQVVRPAGVWFGGDNGSSDMVSVAEFEHESASEVEDENLCAANRVAGGLISGESISLEAFCQIESYVHTLINTETREGLRTASARLASGESAPAHEDTIPDDVYLWFADKIVQAVFCQAVDELYFQRFTSDSRWREEASVNREGVMRRLSLDERKDSVSSSSSSGSGPQESLDTQSKNSSSVSSHSVDSDPGGTHRKGKNISWSNIPASASSPFPQQHSAEREEKIVTSEPLISETEERGMESGDGKSVSFTLERKNSDGGRTLPVEQNITCSISREVSTASKDYVDYSSERTKMLSPSPVITFESIPPSAVNAEIPSCPFSPDLPQALHPASFSSLPAPSSTLLPDHALNRSLESESAEIVLVSEQASVVAGDVSASKSVPSLVSTAVVSGPSHVAAPSTFTSVCGVGPLTGSEQTGASSDLNLDCYRAAAEIVNQVFQSLPEHLAKLSESGRGYRHYHGRKYDAFIPRSSYEVAAAVIGASEKGNVVTESYGQTKVGTGVLSSGRASPRRTRSQSPCFPWLSNRLSRETVTNAFIKVESRPVVKSYERRSSEPCQRSVNLSLQAYTSGRLSSNRSEDGGQKKPHADDYLEQVGVGSWRRGSLDSISLDHRRSSCGFKDPVLSTFAQELMNADTSVPQLFLMSSGSTTSTTASRRSSMSGFRDTTLATFESELLNSSFGQTPSSPSHHRPKRSQSRESRLWRSDSSDTEYWFPIPRRVGSEFQEEMFLRQHSGDDLVEYADFIANTILQQAVAILHHDMREVTREDEDIGIFSENLADQILREALMSSASLSQQQPQRLFTSSMSGSELDLSFSFKDVTGRCQMERQTEFQESVAHECVETFAARLAASIMSGVMEEFGAGMIWVVSNRRPIATGNWGCGAFHGDPCLKVALQWIAASLAHIPRLLYFTFGDARLHQLDAVTRMIARRQWTVGQLMHAVQTYCLTVLSDNSLTTAGTSSCTTPAAAAAAADTDIPSQTLFEFLLTQP